ncbi:hypothetical protein K438DRAFT_1780958 [Mycena galopus ATCC 62051]|nr:hypothetical protein K438DRAFT_1780958 [Mycena galopus ATCC 62051]
MAQLLMLLQHRHPICGLVVGSNPREGTWAELVDRLRSSHGVVRQVVGPKSANYAPTGSGALPQERVAKEIALQNHVAKLEAEAIDSERRAQELERSMHIVSGAQFPSKHDLECAETAQKQSRELRHRCKEERKAFLVHIPPPLWRRR